MMPYTVVLKDVDPKSLHRQITQLEAIQRDMMPDDLTEADTVMQTIKLLHNIEDELRRQARAQHTH